jgi:predicted NBD/HSP70 family sugar kinase
VGLSNKTVNDVTEFLLNEGFIRDYSAAEDSQTRTRGPVPRLFAFCADLGHVLGIDAGADKIVVIVADLAGNVVGSARRPTSSAKPVEILAGIRLAMASALAESQVDKASLKAVAIGTPGVVDAGLIRLAPQLGDWAGVDLGHELDPSLPCPVLVRNEAHLSILAERWRGAAQGFDDAVYIQLGVGVGAALMIRGEAYGGASGAAGEIGYLPLFHQSRVTHDGPGSFEAAVGGNAYARLGREAAATEKGAVLRDLAGGDPATVDAEIVFAAVRLGDPAARRIVETLTATLARGVAAAVVLLDPAAVIIGGGLSRAGDLLLEPLSRHLGRILPAPPRVLLSSLGSDAVALGAVRLACEFAEKQLFEFAP